MSTSSVNPQLKAAAAKFVKMCLDQHDATPQELLAQSQQDWVKLRRESGLERELQIEVPTQVYNVNRDGTVNFLSTKPRAAK